MPPPVLVCLLIVSLINGPNRMIFNESTYSLKKGERLIGKKIEWPLRASKKNACLTKLGKIASRNRFSKDSM